jgi:hypothetical protein
MHISSPSFHPVVTSVEGGELPLDDGSLWGGLPQSNRPLNPMDGIERVVRDTMSEVFASRDEKETEGKFATSTAVRVPGRYFDEGIDPSSSGQAIIKDFLDCIDDIMEAKPPQQITITWIPGHAEIQGNERADIEAKKAAMNPETSQPFKHMDRKGHNRAYCKWRVPN